MSFQPSFARHVYSGFEPSQAFDVIYGGTFEHRLLSSRLATMEHQRLSFGDIRLETGCYDFPVIAQGSMPKDAICIGFVAEGSDTARYNTATIEADEIQIYPAGIELLYQASSASRWVTLTIPEAHLQKVALQRMGRPLTVSKCTVQSIRLHPGGRSALACLATDAMDLARKLQPDGGMAPDLGTEVCESLLAGYVDALSRSASTHKVRSLSTEQRHHHLIAACERLVLSGADADIALAEIARRSGYTLRSLELIFRCGVGMTPGRWFMTARLNGALRDLLTCHQTCSVSAIATKWGFRHMSRFSEYYRKAFGELPSETLNRSRAHG